MGETGSDIADGGDDSDVGEELPRAAASIMQDFPSVHSLLQISKQVREEREDGNDGTVSQERTSRKLRATYDRAGDIYLANCFNNMPKLVLLVVNGHQCWKTPTNEHPAFNLRLPEVWVCVVRAWKQ